MQFRLIHINIFIIFLLIISLNLVDATTIYVNETGWWVNKFNSSSTPIKDAVEYAKENDTVFVVKGNYSENVIINKSISLISNGSRVTAKNPKKKNPSRYSGFNRRIGTVRKCRFKSLVKKYRIIGK